jgi:YidC/Oxa1 family membrane protein insertase
LGAIWSGLGDLLLQVLEFLYKVTGSYGMAIVIITIVVRLLLYPLNQKQMVSMQQMQKIQPRLKMIQEKYGNNKEKMSQETMALYKEYKVNPAAGCLPILVQLPILILLFNVLRVYKGFEGVSFVGILLGSSTIEGIAKAVGVAAQNGTYGMMSVLTGVMHNPAGLSNINFYMGNLVLLISISVLTWAQQKLSGAGNNPQMAMMNTVMPIFMAFICLSMPGGVMLYWALSSLVGVVQQYFVMSKTKQEMLVKPALHQNKPVKPQSDDEDDEEEDDDEEEEEEDKK